MQKNNTLLIFLQRVCLPKYTILKETNAAEVKQLSQLPGICWVHQWWLNFGIVDVCIGQSKWQKPKRHKAKFDLKLVTD